jgi:hypothetical protein
VLKGLHGTRLHQPCKEAANSYLSSQEIPTVSTWTADSYSAGQEILGFSY